MAIVSTRLLRLVMETVTPIILDDVLLGDFDLGPRDTNHNRNSVLPNSR